MSLPDTASLRFPVSVGEDEAFVPVLRTHNPLLYRPSARERAAFAAAAAAPPPRPAMFIRRGPLRNDVFTRQWAGGLPRSMRPRFASSPLPVESHGGLSLAMGNYEYLAMRMAEIEASDALRDDRVRKFLDACERELATRAGINVSRMVTYGLSAFTPETCATFAPEWRALSALRGRIDIDASLETLDYKDRLRLSMQASHADVRKELFSYGRNIRDGSGWSLDTSRSSMHGKINFGSDYILLRTAGLGHATLLSGAHGLAMTNVLEKILKHVDLGYRDFSCAACDTLNERFGDPLLDSLGIRHSPAIALRTYAPPDRIRLYPGTACLHGIAMELPPADQGILRPVMTDLVRVGHARPNVSLEALGLGWPHWSEEWQRPDEMLPFMPPARREPSAAAAPLFGLPPARHAQLQDDWRQYKLSLDVIRQALSRSGATRMVYLSMVSRLAAQSSHLPDYCHGLVLDFSLARPGIFHPRQGFFALNSATPDTDEFAWLLAILLAEFNHEGFACYAVVTGGEGWHEPPPGPGHGPALPRHVRSLAAHRDVKPAQPPRWMQRRLASGPPLAPPIPYAPGWPAHTPGWLDAAGPGLRARKRKREEDG